LRLIALKIAVTVLLVAGSAGLNAQQTHKIYRVGLISPSTSMTSPLEAFSQGLKEAGYIEGKHVVFETRFANGRNERLPDLIAELLSLKIDVLLAAGTPGALAAKKATVTVPIVFGGVVDPVGSGIVNSLSRPGSNITGVTVGVGGEGFTSKSLQLLREATPSLSAVAVLFNPNRPTNAQFKTEVLAAGRVLNMKLEMLEVANADSLERAFAAIDRIGVHGIFVAPDPFLTDSSRKIAQFATSKRLPTMHFSRRLADAGGLMSYGANLEDSFRRAAKHVDQILKGAKPADLPVEQPTRFELVINLKSARAMELKVPQSMVLRADHLIE
jgi:putative tryptophan/tyrosine transport system substrate-binding protein